MLMSSKTVVGKGGLVKWYTAHSTPTIWNLLDEIKLVLVNIKLYLIQLYSVNAMQCNPMQDYLMELPSRKVF